MTNDPTIIVPIDMYVAMSNELDMLRAENAELRSEVTRLRMYAPGGRVEHKIRMAPNVGKLNAKFWGLEAAAEDFDAFGHAVPNESEL